MKKKTALSVLLLICGATAFGGTQGQPSNSRKSVPPPGVCEAASIKLHEAGTDKIVLTMVVDEKGRVQSFTTDSPKGLRLEKMKDAAAAIKGIHFDPARKDGRPVMVMIRTEFDCPGSTQSGSPVQ